MSNRRETRKAYFQGSDVSVDNIVSNDPNKLGYGSKDGVGYDRKPMAVPVGEDARPWEQKWFEGAANETKKVMGPIGEEFDLKKHWLRIPEDSKIANAKLSAKITKKANIKDSYWTISTVDAKGAKQPVIKATFVDLWGNKLSKKVAEELGIPQHADKEIWTDKEVTQAIAEKTASKNYIDNVFKSIRKDGFSLTAYLMTGHDGFMKRAKNGGKVSTAQMEEMVVDAPMVADAPVDAPMGDDMGAAIDSEVENTASEADVTVELLVQKHEELESAQTNLVDKTAPESTADVFVQLQDAEKMVDEAKEEMALASKKLRDKTITAAQKIKFIKLTAEATEEAIDALSNGDNVLDKATQAIESADAAIQQANEVAGGGASAVEAPAGEEISEVVSEAPMADESAPVDAPLAEETINIEAALKGSKAKDFVSKFLQSRADMRKKAADEYGVHPEGAPKDGDDEINRAHPDGGHTLTNVEVGGKPGDNGARFDTVIEQQNHDKKVADKMPTGELSGKSVAVASANKLAELIKTANVDSATKEFWKLLWGQSDAQGKAFGNDLVKDAVPGGNETGKAVAAETQAKVIRAYELADEAIDKGLCIATADGKSKFVKEVLAFNDESFISFKNLVDAAPKKMESRLATASLTTKKIPLVGLKDDSGEVSDDMVSRLSSLNWK